jgi:hypothetical protein
LSQREDRTPALRRAIKSNHGRTAEKKAAKRIGGKITPASGALQHSKGDIRKDRFLIDSKATVNESFRLTTEQLAKISKEALDAGKDPAILVQFVNHSGRVHAGSWVVIPERVFREVGDWTL